jgi:hypothetical protein
MIAVLLFPHLIFQHFLQMPSRLWIRHFHLSYVFTQRYPTTLFMIILPFFYTKRGVDLCFKMFSVLFFFTFKSLLLDVVSIDRILLLTCTLDSCDVAKLFN